MGRFSQSGRRLVPGIEVGSEEARKSESEGPEFKLSVKDVWGRRGDMVARLRIVRFEVIDSLELFTEVFSISLQHIVKCRIVSMY